MASLFNDTGLTGRNLIAGEEIAGEDHFRAANPATGESLEPAFHEADGEIIDEAARQARSAFRAFRRCGPEERAGLLESIASQLEVIGPEITKRAGLETALPPARLQGELGRTCGQLRLFASHLREQGDGPVREIPADPERQPLPRPALRQQAVPVGPVVVFGASNFPLAFSVAGGDTASALAAGCPVVVKGHPAHPGTSELAARAIAAALDERDLPAGVFSLVQSSRNDVAAELVRHPAIRAVGFTGSMKGGRALCDVAAARPDPIPVFAEMGSSNPVFLMPHALAARGEAIGKGFAQSLLMGEGQFCTNPGLVIAVAGEALDAFTSAFGAALAEHQPTAMLTAAIRDAFEAGLQTQRDADGVGVVAEGPEAEAPATTQAVLLRVGLESFLDQPGLQEEVFGPASLLVTCGKSDDFARVAASLRGQLTATVHADPEDREAVQALLPDLEGLAGRVLFNGFPTGVEVSPAMVHGGPWPATSDGRGTSVGTRAMERFQRWVCYQDQPDWL